jgi:hypothetical protein
VKGPRDQLELSLRTALEPFFDIRSITFSRPDVAPRASDAPGWQQTVLAYIQVRAKDASVDRVPPIEMELSFLDLTGPVTIPVESAETVMKVQSEPPPPPRPAEKIQLIQTLDPRQLASSGALSLRIKATAVGLVPELDQIVDLSAMKPTAEVKSISPHAGTQVKEINSWGEKVAATSEREWTIVLDAPGVRENGGVASFNFPAPKRPEVTTANQTYDDMNLVNVKGSTTQIGEAGMGPVVPAWRKWVIPAVVALAVIVIGIIVAVLRRGGRTAAPAQVRARDVFKMPEQVDGFVVVRLLNGLAASPLVAFGPSEQSAVRQDIDRVQKSTFAPGGTRMTTAELQEIARKWLSRLN